MSKRAYARHSSTQREGDTHGMHMNDTAHIRTPHTFGRAFFSGDSSACGAARLFPARGAAAGGAAAGGGAGRRACSCRQRQSASRRP